MKIPSGIKELYFTGIGSPQSKSSVAIMGMNGLAEMLKTFELQAREGKEPPLYEHYLERFKSETEEAVRELEDLISNMKNGNWMINIEKKDKIDIISFSVQ